MKTFRSTLPEKMKAWLRSRQAVTTEQMRTPGGNFARLMRVRDDEGAPRMIVLYEYEGGNGFEIYIPADDGTGLDDTIASLEGWLSET